MNIGATVKRRNKYVVRGLLSVMMVAALAACGEKKETSGGQVIASVDGTEITVHQLNNELGKTGGQQGSKKVLEDLVVRQLLVNAAKKDKLDADPAVLADLERARDMTLAQSYVTHNVKPPMRPASLDVNEFYKNNADWFALRKQYEFTQLIIGAASLTPELSELMGSGKTIEDVASWLGQRRIQYVRKQVVKASGDLPIDMAKRLKTMPRGQLFIVNEGASAILTSVQDSKDAPLSLEVATPQIEQFLAGQRQAQAIEQVIAGLRQKSKIEYSEQAKALKDPNAPPDPSQTGSDKNATQRDAIGRGMAGFK